MAVKLTSSPVKLGAPAIDLAYNAFHTRMAVAAADQSISVWEHGDGEGQLWMCSSSWEAHSDQIMQVVWAHPEHGQILASCSWDCTVCIWEQQPRTAKDHQGEWLLRAELRDSQHPQTAIAFAPPQYGLRLAAASTDGCIRLYEASAVLAAKSWGLENDFQASPMGGCTAVAWRPHAPSLPPLLLVGTSQDAQVWVYTPALASWERSATVSHGGPVDCVDWAPAMGRPLDLVAAGCGQQVVVASLSGRAEALQVEVVATLDHHADVWRVEWNLLGNTLAASTTARSIVLWRPNLTGEWQLLSRIAGDGSEGQDRMLD